MTAAGDLRIKGFVPWVLVALVALFAFLCLVPKSRQSEIFIYDELCDFRMFILPCIKSERPYVPNLVRARDACYPPVAYCAVKALSADRGAKWNLTNGEKRLVCSIFLLELLGAILLTAGIPQTGRRAAIVLAVLMSPACFSSVLRGNPSGWSFGLVCVFLHWYSAKSAAKRMLAAVALGAATSLKLTPCLFGVLYLVDAFDTPRRIPAGEILLAAGSAGLFVFMPFLFFGGMDQIMHWASNAMLNAGYYSVNQPMWGLVAFANNLIDTNEPILPCAGLFAMATRVLACILVVLCFFARRNYTRLLFIGAAMAFLTHHDYGGAYLLPAFVAWLQDGDVPDSGVWLLLEVVAWCVIVTPLQIPNPCSGWTLNRALQNEFLFVLLISAFIHRSGRKTHECISRQVR